MLVSAYFLFCGTVHRIRDGKGQASGNQGPTTVDWIRTSCGRVKRQGCGARVWSGVLHVGCLCEVTVVWLSGATLRPPRFRQLWDRRTCACVHAYRYALSQNTLIIAGTRVPYLAFAAA